MRSVLLEYGIAVPVGNKSLMQRLPELLEEVDNGLPILSRQLLSELKADYEQLAERIGRLEQQLQAWHQQSEQSQRLETMPGVGLLTATSAGCRHC